MSARPQRTRPASRIPPTARAARGFVVHALGPALGFLLALAPIGCADRSDPDGLRRERALIVEGPALARLLDRGQALAGTRAGRAALALRDRVGACEVVVAHWPSPDAPALASSSHAPARPERVAHVGANAATSPLDRLACERDAPLDPALAASMAERRGERAGLLQWPIGESGALELAFDVDAAGGLTLSGLVGGADATTPLGTLLPDDAPPAPARIASDRALLHLQLRPAAGTGLAALIPEGSQGDRLFALKGRLLEGALLEGTLELALLPPAPGGSVPLVVLALHHRAAAPVEAALDEALARLDRTWGLARSPRAFPAAGDAGTRGGCYADLPLLPELAPCWVVTGDALLVGYRPEAIETALAPATPATPPAPPSASRLVVDFDRMRESDRAAAAMHPAAPGSAAPPRAVAARASGLAEVYSRLELQARRDADGRVRFDGGLRARP